MQLRRKSGSNIEEEVYKRFHSSYFFAFSLKPLTTCRTLHPFLDYPPVFDSAVPVMFATSALAIIAAFSAVLPTEALHLQTRQSDGGKGLTSPGAVGFDYPPLRGWSLDAGKKPICGGFDLHARTDFPASKSVALIRYTVTDTLVPPQPVAPWRSCNSETATMCSSRTRTIPVSSSWVIS